MPQLGILQVTAEGGTRFAAHSHGIAPDGLVVAEVTPIAPEPSVALRRCASARSPSSSSSSPRASGRSTSPRSAAFDDASWVGYRLAELLPLPLPMKQDLLEMNDAEARLAALQRFIGERGLL